MHPKNKGVIRRLPFIRVSVCTVPGVEGACVVEGAGLKGCTSKGIVFLTGTGLVSAGALGKDSAEWTAGAF